MARKALASTGILLLLLAHGFAAEGELLASLFGHGTRVNGLEVPSGTTVGKSSSVETAAWPATLHFRGGELIRIEAHSRLLVGGSAAASRIESGSARVRSFDGAVTLLEADTESFGQTGRVNQNVGQGQVARLAAATSPNSTEIRVNTSERILETAPILIRSATTGMQAVYYIQSVNDERIRLTDRVGRNFDPGDLVFQGDELDNAIAGGAIIVGGPSTGGGGISTGALIGILVGVGAGAGLAAAAAGGGGGGGGGTTITP